MVSFHDRADAALNGGTWRWLVLMVAFLGWMGSACIQYPNCENDDHCKEQSEFCLNGKCAECRLDTHCGEGRRCVAGGCEKIPGFCKGNTDCVGKEKCRNNQCGPECTNDAECGTGERCNDEGKCVASVCVTDSDCPDGQDCRDGNCVSKPVSSGSGACSNLEPVFFDYDESALRADARNTLRKHADCVNSEKKRLLIEGHCDDRGTEEYNLALGERRAKTTRDYIEQLGVRRSMMKTISYGESKPAKYGKTESVFQLNRRCEFKWQ